MHTYLQNRDFERVQRDSANWNDNGARAWHVAAGSQMLVNPRSKFRTFLKTTPCDDFEDAKKRQNEILLIIFILDKFGRPAGGDNDRGLLNWKLVSAEE